MVFAVAFKSTVAVRARVPEKQGLKRRDQFVHAKDEGSPGASSRKTRIETREGPGPVLGLYRPGASSRKTRIETEICRGRPRGSAVRARVPEKQGLKQLHEFPAAALAGSPGASSRKTRIETLVTGRQGFGLSLSGREFQKNKD